MASGIGPVDSFSTERDQHLDIRKLDVTASVAGALFGVHPYATTLRLYLEKRGVEFKRSDNSVTRRGRWLEPAIGRAVAEERPDWQVNAAGMYLRDPTLRLGCTPDFFVPNTSPPIVLQVKSVAPLIWEREWLEGATIPQWIMIQNTVERMLTEARLGGPVHGVIAALVVDAFDMRVHIFENFECDYTPEKIIDALCGFWTDVEFGREPTPDFEKDEDIVQERFPKHVPGSVHDFAGSNEVQEMLGRREDLCARIKRMEADVDVVETEIKYLMRDAEMATGLAGWKITYKVEPRKGYTVAPSEPRVLRIRRKEGQQ